MFHIKIESTCLQSLKQVKKI